MGNSLTHPTYSRILRSKLSCLKHTYLSNRPLRRTIQSIKSNRGTSTPIPQDLGFLEALHPLFPTIHTDPQYEFGILLKKVQERYAYLEQNGVCLKGADVLDIGAGTGENLWISKEYGFGSATAVDYSADRYKERLPDLEPDIAARITFLEGDMETVPLPENSYDLILSVNSFEHFPDPTAILQKCFQLLRSGGFFYTHFGPLFRSAHGAHRYRFCAVPYIQNLFEDPVAYEFFYKILKINDEVNRYTGESIDDSNPYPEMNKWTLQQFENLFRGNGQWEVIQFEKKHSHRFAWFVSLFREELRQYSTEDLYVTELVVILRKK